MSICVQVSFYFVKSYSASNGTEMLTVKFQLPVSSPAPSCLPSISLLSLVLCLKFPKCPRKHTIRAGFPFMMGQLDRCLLEFIPSDVAGAFVCCSLCVMSLVGQVKWLNPLQLGLQRRGNSVPAEKAGVQLVTTCPAMAGYVVSGQLWAHCAEAQTLTSVLRGAVLPSGVFLGTTR